MDMQTLFTNTSAMIPLLEKLVWVLCYLMGLIFGIGALMAAARASQGRGNDNGGYGGAITSFGIACCLVAAPSLLGAMTESLSGSSQVASVLGYNPQALNAAGENVKKTVHTALQWCQLFGIIAFIKGLMLVRQTANGTGPQTYGPGMIYICGGVCAANIVLIINAIGSTLGMNSIVGG